MLCLDFAPVTGYGLHALHDVLAYETWNPTYVRSKTVPYARNRETFRVVAEKRRQRIADIKSRLEYIDGVPVHPDPPGGHGSNSAYNTAGCRCAMCQAGAHEYYLQQKERQRKMRTKRQAPAASVDLDSVFSFRPETTATSEDSSASPQPPVGPRHRPRRWPPK